MDERCDLHLHGEVLGLPISPLEKLVLSGVIQFHKNNGCWASHEFFADWMGVKKRTIGDAFRNLTKAGLIVKKGHKSVPNVPFNVSKSTDNVPFVTEKRNVTESVTMGTENGTQHTENVTDVTDSVSPSELKDNKKQIENKTTKRAAAKKAEVSRPRHNPEAFEAFWAAWPGGGPRLEAVKAWDRLQPDDELIKTIALDIPNRLANDHGWREVQFIGHASTYLNQRKWEGKITPKYGGDPTKRGFPKPRLAQPTTVPADNEHGMACTARIGGRCTCPLNRDEPAVADDDDGYMPIDPRLAAMIEAGRSLEAEESLFGGDE